MRVGGTFWNWIMWTNLCQVSMLISSAQSREFAASDTLYWPSNIYIRMRLKFLTTGVNTLKSREGWFRSPGICWRYSCSTLRDNRTLEYFETASVDERKFASGRRLQIKVSLSLRWFTPTLSSLFLWNLSYPVPRMIPSVSWTKQQDLTATSISLDAMESQGTDGATSQSSNNTERSQISNDSDKTNWSHSSAKN